MFTRPDRIGQLAGEHHHQMLAQASKRQLRHQHGRPAASIPIIGRLAAAIARAGAVTAQAPGRPKIEALDCTVLHCPTWVSATGPVLTFRLTSCQNPGARTS